MIHFRRTVDVQSGKMGEVLGVAGEITAYLKRKYDMQVELLIPVAGNPMRVAWVATFEDLTTLEDTMRKMLADKDYLRLRDSGGGAVISGTTLDEIWAAV